MSWDDDWRERDRQEKEEAYDRWYAEKEAEADARSGRYDRPSYSETAWDAYESKWQETDREVRWEAVDRERKEQDERDWNDRQARWERDAAWERDQKAYDYETLSRLVWYRIGPRTVLKPKVMQATARFHDPILDMLAP